jgi:hypothetical protein
MVVADTHVHLYPCFDAEAAFDAARRNLAAASQRVAPGARCQMILCLAETAQCDFFASLATAPSALGRWTSTSTAEAESVVMRDSKGASGELIVIAGRQVVTREGLEILALGTTDRFADGLPAAATLDAVHTAGALAVLPWGVGKWHGARGALVDGLLDRPGARPYLGDNGNRLRVTPYPERFSRALRAGLRVLPGSDPLPLRGEEGRIGGHGVALDAAVSAERPARDFTTLLRGDAPAVPFGEHESVSRFVRNQLAMQIAKRLRRTTAADAAWAR